MLPNFTDIQYFLEVAQTNNISRAAERLGITQPSLSSAIKRLEDAVGTQLFTRSRSGVQPTKAGQELVKKGRLLLLNWEQLKSDINRRESAVTGQYIIGCHPSVALYSLPHFLPDLMIEHPELEIKLVHDLSRKITESVISYQADFGIVVNPVNHDDLVIRELCQDEVGFWTTKKPTKNQKVDSASAVLICDQNLNQVQKLFKDVQKQKVVFPRIIHSTNLEVITELTSQGAGIGILPSRVATRHKSFGLKSLSDSLPVFKDKICLVYRADSQKTKGREKIIEAIKAAFQ
ncbi:MAG: LysR family transcriptional regulator [Pseudomonadota bacterium]